MPSGMMNPAPIVPMVLAPWNLPPWTGLPPRARHAAWVAAQSRKVTVRNPIALVAPAAVASVLER